MSGQTPVSKQGSWKCKLQSHKNKCKTPSKHKPFHPNLKFASNSQQLSTFSTFSTQNERLPNEPFQVVFMFFISHSFGEADPQEIQQPGAFPPGWRPTLKL